MSRRVISVVQMTVDRIEEGYAILIPRDNPEESIDLPLKYLPGVEEGDILEVSLRKDEVATYEAADRISILREKLLNR